MFLKFVITNLVNTLYRWEQCIFCVQSSQGTGLASRMYRVGARTPYWTGRTSR